MASVEFIQSRLDGKKKSLKKLEEKLSRILLAEESNYENNNPYYYNAGDKRNCLKDIESCKSSISEYERQLNVEREKLNSRNVPAITHFLCLWKEHMFNFYKEGITNYYNERQELKELYNKFCNRYDISVEDRHRYECEYYSARQSLHNKVYGYYEEQEFINPHTKNPYKTKVKVRDGELAHIKPYIERCSNADEALSLLNKELEQEKIRKYDFIIERTNAIVGTIIDASGLRVGAKYDLNGIIIGDRGKAFVETFGAGGYNTDTIVNVKHGQIFHYRTVIKEIK